MQNAPTSYTYKTAGECDIQADVYRCAETPEPSAAIVFIHGGALINGSRKHINPVQLDLYLAAGFTVVSIDYRLAPETKLPGIIEDLRDAFAWVANDGPGLIGIDPSRIGVVGHSAGGYLALMSGFKVEPRPKAIVSFYGYGAIADGRLANPSEHYLKQDLVPEEEIRDMRNGPPVSHWQEGRPGLRFYLYCRQQGVWPKEVSGHDPADGLEFFRPCCPIQNVTADYPPTMLLHGDCDTDVHHSRSIDMAEELRRHNVEHELIVLEGCGHGFDGKMDDPMVRSAFDRSMDFLRARVSP